MTDKSSADDGHHSSSGVLRRVSGAIPPAAAALSALLFLATGLLLTYRCALGSTSYRQLDRITREAVYPTKLTPRVRDAHRQKAYADRLKRSMDRVSGQPYYGIFGVDPAPWTAVSFGAALVVGLLAGHTSLSVMQGELSRYTGRTSLTCLYGGLATFFIFVSVLLQMIPSPTGPGGLITGCGPALPLYAAAMWLQGVRSLWKRTLVFTFVTFAAVWVTLIVVVVGLT